jgi:hypothetical protein
MQRVELVIGFQEDIWTARADHMFLNAPSWNELLQKIYDYYLEEYPKHKVEVYYRFDMQAIPRWFHQYQTHYFNGKLTIR